METIIVNEVDEKIEKQSRDIAVTVLLKSLMTTLIADDSEKWEQQRRLIAYFSDGLINGIADEHVRCAVAPRVCNVLEEVLGDKFTFQNPS